MKKRFTFLLGLSFALYIQSLSVIKSTCPTPCQLCQQHTDWWGSMGTVLRADLWEVPGLKDQCLQRQPEEKDSGFFLDCRWGVSHESNKCQLCWNLSVTPLEKWTCRNLQLLIIVALWSMGKNLQSIYEVFDIMLWMKKSVASWRK